MGIIFTTYIHLDDPPKMMPMTYDESNFEDELTHSMGENVGFVHAKWKPLQKDRLFLERLDMLSRQSWWRKTNNGVGGFFVDLNGQLL